MSAAGEVKLPPEHDTMTNGLKMSEATGFEYQFLVAFGWSDFVEHSLCVPFEYRGASSSTRVMPKKQLNFEDVEPYCAMQCLQSNDSNSCATGLLLLAKIVVAADQVLSIGGYVQTRMSQWAHAACRLLQLLPSRRRSAKPSILKAR